MTTARQYSLVIIGGEGSPLSAVTLPLVAALIALDCQPRPDAPMVETLEDVSAEGVREPVIKHEHRWIFSDKSACGRYATATLRRGWNSAEWLANNLAHPLARIRGAFHLAGVSPLSADPSAWLDCEPANVAQFLAVATASGPVPAEWLNAEYRAAHRSVFPTAAAVGDAFAVLELLREEVKKSVPLMIVRKGQKRAFVPIDATPEEEAFLLSRLEKSNQ